MVTHAQLTDTCTIASPHFYAGLSGDNTTITVITVLDHSGAHRAH